MREFKDSVSGKEEPEDKELPTELPPAEPDPADAQARERDAVH
jgi:hypothetical protein